MPYKIIITFVGILSLSGNAAAFQSQVSPSVAKPDARSSLSQTSTQLNAVLPPMIIGPALKKMREKQAKKKMPMVSRDEAKGEAPGLRVGANVWKWPPIWPYDREFFMPTEDIPPKPNMGLNEMASMVSGIQQPPEAAAAAAAQAAEEQETLNVIDYWGKQKADVRTEMDQEAIEKIKR